MCDLFECVYCDFENLPIECDCSECVDLFEKSCVDCAYYHDVDCPEWGKK